MLECSIVFQRQRHGTERQALVARVEEIFVVPVCSILALTPQAYLDFLRRVGALRRAARLVATANLRRADAEAAETLRREVRAILTAAEVDLLTPPIPKLNC
jgi:hypothetical protein